MNKLLILFGVIFFISCNDQAFKEQTNTKKQDSKSDIDYSNWQTAKGEKIEFKYPSSWRIKINKAQGTTQFGLTNDMDTSSRFYPVEIWEFNASGGTFEEFAGAPHQYFEKATDGERANLINSAAIKFKELEAKEYEFSKNNYPVQIITVNGIKEYYMLISYKSDSVSRFANEIFNSIKISTQ
jgi:hypothetical protein